MFSHPRSQLPQHIFFILKKGSLFYYQINSSLSDMLKTYRNRHLFITMMLRVSCRFSCFRRIHKTLFIRLIFSNLLSIYLLFIFLIILLVICYLAILEFLFTLPSLADVQQNNLSKTNGLLCMPLSDLS